MTRIAILALALLPVPAFAASGPFFSLNNTDFVVSLGFLIFVGVLVYMKVPAKITEMLDARAESIKSDLAEARALREEAQSLLASYERKQKEVQEHADRIVAAAREQAQNDKVEAEKELALSVERRVKAAKEQIVQAEEDAKRQVRNRAVEVAVAAARQVLAEQMNAERSGALFDRSIETISQKLH
ncbi:ATP F0F1 synthase subunit B [Palleronia caenipelagi]|uniref:ATP synthase subunit b n=1 Tax=Palleronia caenipelagi TaxID=2489174 RepID=A0A547Q7K3_9RHOB|nr:ATP F0F1 synthase subunit B [Palleronia caenipelagi]TRD22360.1 ATP F0F1 synthase subunit B [Palleronia caenipelagi]